MYQLPDLGQSIDQFEDRVWQDDQVRGLDTGSKRLNDALEGLQPGWHVLAADSNTGKSAFLSWLETNILRLNEDAVVLSLTLDDPQKEKLARVIAAEGRVLINAVRRPKAYEQVQGMLRRREEAIAAIRRYQGRYFIIGSDYQTPKGPACDIDAIEWLVEQLMIRIEEEALKTGKRKKAVVFVDNFHDTTMAQRVKEESKFEILASRYADLAIRYDIALITTAELRKVNGYRRPIIDEIRDSTKIKYEAKSIWMGFNEVSLRGEMASVYYEIPGNPNRQPVWELHIAKNKFNNAKPRIFYQFRPELSWFHEADASAQKRLMAVINSGE